MAQADDVRLLQDCIAGKAGSWEAFVARFASYLAEACRRALRRCRRPAGPQETADMLQTVFLHFLERDMRALRLYRGRGSLASYLALLAARRVLDDRSLRPGEPAPAFPPERTDPAAGPPEVLEQREAEALLREAMAQLPSRARLALILQAEGRSVRQIGEVLGISEDAAAQVLGRAREIVRKSVSF